MYSKFQQQLTLLDQFSYSEWSEDVESGDLGQCLSHIDSPCGLIQEEVLGPWAIAIQSVSDHSLQTQSPSNTCPTKTQINSISLQIEHDWAFPRQPWQYYINNIAFKLLYVPEGKTYSQIIIDGLDIEEGRVDGLVDGYWCDVRRVNKLWGAGVSNDGDDHRGFSTPGYSWGAVVRGTNIKL